jgi:hypothetical protein
MDNEPKYPLGMKMGFEKHKYVIKLQIKDKTIAFMPLQWYFKDIELFIWHYSNYKKIKLKSL